ncbi:hypothetical protein NAEGRDRAFT_59947 [Naegleria gruberi]|uniref:F-box domain-containing protein n=1 Tax=Naegleria gruberi TaxID=5762 RepID=D2W2M9_NAEGR|nr:uncharacterized protein NAEGRDRAFT_59947 [Naegleria gruberi]EFC36677.1 hypothetical protein NAEGRDRAFT_59947 [Naegleria gruberi]|eukprot:XP_002669421.1 hypothetical protein NAEGRDRAFT_59947 [Naegleria gruberi strain NEG-M]
MTQFSIEDLPYEIFDHIFYYLLPSAETRKVTGFNDLLAISHTNRALRERMRNNSFFWSSVFARFTVFVSTYFVEDFPLVFDCEKEFSNCSVDQENGNYYYSLLKEITKEYIMWLQSFCDLSLIRKLEIPIPVDDSPDEIMKLWSENTTMLSYLLMYPVDVKLRMETFIEKSKISFSHLDSLDIFDGFVDPHSIIHTPVGSNLRKIALDMPKEAKVPRESFIKNFVESCKNLSKLETVELCSECLSITDELYESLLCIAPKLKNIGIDNTQHKSLENWNKLAPNLTVLKRLCLQTCCSVQLENNPNAKRYTGDYKIFVVPHSVSDLTVMDNINVGGFFEEVTFSVCFNGILLPKLKKLDLQISCVITENQKPFPNLECFYYDTFGNSLTDQKTLFNFWMNKHEKLKTVLFSSLPSEVQTKKQKEKQVPELILKKKLNRMKALNIRSDAELYIEDCPIQLTVYNIGSKATIKGRNVKRIGLNFNESLNQETSVYVDVGKCNDLDIDYSKSSKTHIHISGNISNLELIASRVEKFEFCHNIHLDETAKLSLSSVSVPSLFLQQHEQDDLARISGKFCAFLSQFSNLKNLKIVVHEDYVYNIDTQLTPVTEDLLHDIFSKKFNLVSNINSLVYNQRALSLHSFTSLQYLYLKGPHKFKFVQIPNLKILEMNRCNIEGAEVDLTGMTQLQSIKIWDMSYFSIILQEQMDHLKHFLVYSIKELKSKLSIKSKKLRSFIITKIGKLARHSFIEISETPKILFKVIHLPDESTPTSPIPTFEDDEPETIYEDQEDWN